MHACKLCGRMVSVVLRSNRASLPRFNVVLNSTSRKTSVRYYNSTAYTSSESMTESGTKQKKTSINPEEVKKFNALASKWWDTKGELKGLHSMNRLRVPLIRDTLMRQHRVSRKSRPLEGLRILDVGCGGGILSVPLAKLGAQVTGLDASEEAVKAATAHMAHDPSLKDTLTFTHGTVEDLVASEVRDYYDALVASEVIEHVDALDDFVGSSCDLVKPGGSLFFTTINRTNQSYYLAVIAAEYIVGVVPRGTHNWNKFVSPEELKDELRANNCHPRLIHGMFYNPFLNHWNWTGSTEMNYALHAIKDASEADLKKD
ncbi:COQ3 [Branchiostoma lanceolatum]|uniref:Ubiquinone biosynthesis O-methyltransferase, mitochondrial n=2 Tax=Branchiostoma lanceolatum TaxID=7740 RepID=A0A8J9VYL1_BRALA|nr:COQ3 [Branchiostoma lanceolatum]